MLSQKREIFPEQEAQMSRIPEMVGHGQENIRRSAFSGQLKKGLRRVSLVIL
jgi:hypothetical protein